MIQGYSVFPAFFFKPSMPPWCLDPYSCLGCCGMLELRRTCRQLAGWILVVSRERCRMEKRLVKVMSISWKIYRIETFVQLRRRHGISRDHMT
jgi:hypothetical protein